MTYKDIPIIVLMFGFLVWSLLILVTEIPEEPKIDYPLEGLEIHRPI